MRNFLYSITLINFRAPNLISVGSGLSSVKLPQTFIDMGYTSSNYLENTLSTIFLMGLYLIHIPLIYALNRFLSNSSRIYEVLNKYKDNALVEVLMIGYLSLSVATILQIQNVFNFMS